MSHAEQRQQQKTPGTGLRWHRNRGQPWRSPPCFRPRHTTLLGLPYLVRLRTACSLLDQNTTRGCSVDSIHQSKHRRWKGKVVPLHERAAAMEEDIWRSDEAHSDTRRRKVRAIISGGGGGFGPLLVLGGALAAAAFTSRVLQRRGLNTTSSGPGQIDGDTVPQKDVSINSTEVDGTIDEDGGERGTAAVEGRGSGMRNAADGEDAGRAAEVEGRRGSGGDVSITQHPAPQGWVSEQPPLLPAPLQPALLPPPPVLLALPPPSTNEEDSRRPEQPLVEVDAAPDISSSPVSRHQYTSLEERQPANQEEEEEDEAGRQEEQEEDQDGVDEHSGVTDVEADDVVSSEEPESSQVSDATAVESISSVESSAEPIWPAEAATDSSSSATSPRPSTPEEEHGMKIRNDAFQTVDGKGPLHADGGRSGDKQRRPLTGKSEKRLVIVPASGISSRGFVQLAMTMAAVMTFLALAHHHGDIAAACRRLYRELFPAG